MFAKMPWVSFSDGKLEAYPTENCRLNQLAQTDYDYDYE